MTFTPPIDYMDGIWISSEHGLLKPEPEAYRSFFESMKLEPSSCYFIDDSPANVEADMVRQIENFKVHIFRQGEGGPCILVGESDREEEGAGRLADCVAVKSGDRPYTLVIFEVTDWNTQLSPWPAQAAFGNEDFMGCGADTLAWLTERCIPVLKADGLICEDTGLFLAGYSLAGLFALWALMESELFDGAATCSGSLWFNGWMDYIRTKRRGRDACVYMSLGSREERTRNTLMSTVGDSTRETYEILKRRTEIKKITLQWNKGGHFADADERLAKGIQWLLNLRK